MYNKDELNEVPATDKTSTRLKQAARERKEEGNLSERKKQRSLHPKIIYDTIKRQANGTI